MEKIEKILEVESKDKGRDKGRGSDSRVMTIVIMNKLYNFHLHLYLIKFNILNLYINL